MTLALSYWKELDLKTYQRFSEQKDLTTLTDEFFSENVAKQLVDKLITLRVVDSPEHLLENCIIALVEGYRVVLQLPYFRLYKSCYSHQHRHELLMAASLGTGWEPVDPSTIRVCSKIVHFIPELKTLERSFSGVWIKGEFILASKDDDDCRIEHDDNRQKYVKREIPQWKLRKAVQCTFESWDVRIVFIDNTRCIFDTGTGERYTVLFDTKWSWRYGPSRGVSYQKFTVTCPKWSNRKHKL